MCDLVKNLLWRVPFSTLVPFLPQCCELLNLKSSHALHTHSFQPAWNLADFREPCLHQDDGLGLPVQGLHPVRLRVCVRASLCVCARAPTRIGDAAPQPAVAFFLPPGWPCPGTRGLPGAGPSGGVQRCSQQGVPLPDENRFHGCPEQLPMRPPPGCSSIWLQLAAQKTSLLPSQAPACTCGLLCPCWTALSSFVLFTEDLCVPGLQPGHLGLRTAGLFFFPLPLNPSGQVEGQSHLQGTGQDAFRLSF